MAATISPSFISQIQQALSQALSQNPNRASGQIINLGNLNLGIGITANPNSNARTNPNEPLSEAFHAKSPKTIKYAFYPPRIRRAKIEESATIKVAITGITPLKIEQAIIISGYLYRPFDCITMSPHEFAHQNGFTWINSLMISRSLRDNVWGDKTIPKETLGPSAIKDRLENPLEGLEVCEMEDGIGKGVFLSLEAEPLPIGTVFDNYAAHLMSYYDQTEEDPYEFFIEHYGHYQTPAWTKTTFPMRGMTLRADKFGSISRFVQDMPAQEEIEPVTNVDDTIKRKFTIPNLVPVGTIVDGFPIRLLVTVKVVNPGDEFGFQYGTANWNIARAVRDIDGNVIGHFSKDGKTILLKKSIDYSKLSDVPRLDYKVIQPMYQSYITPSCNEYDYQKSFTENVNYCLNEYASRFEHTSVCGQYISTLKDRFNQQKKSDESFKILAAYLNDSVSKEGEVKSNLGGLKKELIYLMNQYNASRSKVNTAATVTTATAAQTNHPNPPIVTAFNAHQQTAEISSNRNNGNAASATSMANATNAANSANVAANAASSNKPKKKKKKAKANK